MNQENGRTAGRIVTGYLLGLVLALLLPLLMLTEVMSLMPVVLLPSIALVFIRRWSGTAPAIFAALMQMVFASSYLGEGYFWILFFSSVFPLLMLLRSEDKPFFAQMRRSIYAFGAGLVLSAIALYAAYGGNIIQRALMQLPAAVRMMPEEAAQRAAASYASIAGTEISVEGFHRVFDEMISSLIPAYQLNLPGLVFSGAFVTAVVCTAINARMLHREEEQTQEQYLPLHEWALPASATGGLLLIALISFVMSKTGMQGGSAVFYAVLSITATAFCIQTLASAARRLRAAKLKRGAVAAITAAIALASLFGANTYTAVYGCASAIFGSKGALRQYAQQNNTDKKDNDSSNDA